MSQPEASAVALTPAAMESPMPSWPASSRCQARPLARTASRVRSRTGLPASMAWSLEPMPPEARKREPWPEARTRMVGWFKSRHGAAGHGLGRRRDGVLALDDLRDDGHGDLRRGLGADAQAHGAM